MIFRAVLFNFLHYVGIHDKFFKILLLCICNDWTDRTMILLKKLQIRLEFWSGRLSLIKSFWKIREELKGSEPIKDRRKWYTYNNHFRLIIRPILPSTDLDAPQINLDPST